MEVHAHTHTERKRLKHYLFEFFMLFLAVFCGFLAENWREKIVEHRHEKEFIESELSDLQLDTARLNYLLTRWDVTVTRIDSLIELLHSGSYSSHLNDVYFMARVVSFTPRFNYAARTIQQLKNSGSLRLIRSKEASDSLVVYYDIIVPFMQSQDQIILNAAAEYRNVATELFDPYVFYQILKGNLGTAVRPINSPNLLTTDITKINAVLSKLMYLRSIVVNTMDIYRQAKRSADNLLEILKKEYHLQ
jgi:hypothetical protein